MEISTQKLSDGIVLTLRSPSDSTKSPVIILCHGLVLLNKSNFC